MWNLVDWKGWNNLRSQQANRSTRSTLSACKQLVNSGWDERQQKAGLLCLWPMEESAHTNYSIVTSGAKVLCFCQHALDRVLRLH